MQDSHRFFHLVRRPTLRYSFYRAYDHNFVNNDQIELEIQQLVLQEIGQQITHKEEAIKTKQKYLVPL